MRPPVARTTSSRTSPPATCSAPRCRRAPSSAARPRSTWTRGELRARRHHGRHRRRAARPATTRAAAASSSTASPARCPRPRRSTRSPPIAAARPRHRPRGAPDGRARAPRRPAGVHGLRHELLRRPARPSTAGSATSAAARSCSAPTTPRRRSPKRLDLYERETAPLIDWYADRRLLVEVDGLGAARRGHRPPASRPSTSRRREAAP